jgi:hypothetical protein
LRSARARIEELKGRVNNKAETMYNTTKENLASLQEKRGVVEKDKAQIMTVGPGPQGAAAGGAAASSRCLPPARNEGFSLSLPPLPNPNQATAA